MKIAFNPSTVAALTTPPNNKDITFDLRGRNIFARGVKFCGTDTNTWRDIKINNVSIGSHTLDLRNGSNTTLTNTNGVVTINSTWRPVVDNLTSDSTTSSLSAKQGKVLKSLIDGKSNSGHTHDDRYLKLTGGIMTGTINRRSGGSTISGRDHAIIRQTYAPGGSSWNPIACVDTETGTWTLGHLSSGDSDTNFHFCFSTNADYNAGNNNGNYVTLRNKVGTIALLSDIPSSLKNPHALTISLNGTSQGPYDGSAAKSINITPSSIGAAPSSHSHNYAANENYGGFTKSGRLPISGFYQSNESESGGNAPWSGWMHLINCQHNNTGNNYALQIAASFGNNNTFKIRVTNNNVNNAWRDIIHSGNIGSQTVANADKLDGTHLNGIFTAFGNNAHNITATIGGVTKSFLVNWAADSDKLDGYHENSFLRYRGGTSTDQEATLWSQIGIKQYNNALPDNLTGVYNYGSVISLPGSSSRFEIYASHISSSGNGLYYRSGWDSNKKTWLKFIDSSNIGSQSVNYANSAGNADKLDGIHANGLLTALSNSNNGISITVGGTTKSVSNISVNYASSAGSATKVIVNQHTTNDTNYPLVWSNQSNTNSVTENQLYKSWSDLYYNPKNKRLTVGGSIYAAHFYESSDKTLKKNIKSILSSTNIPKIREFDWKDTGEHSYGFIAQELEEQGYGCLVKEANGKKTVNYTATLALTVAKLQNLINIQNKKISNLTKELKALKYGRKKNS